MPDVPPFLQVPGVPGGRIATGGLTPEAQQGYMAQYGGAPSFPNTPGGIPEGPPDPYLHPQVSDMQKQSLHDTYRPIFNETPQDVLARDRAMQLAKAGGFDFGAHPPPASAQPPPAGPGQQPPPGQASGPLGAATATLKGSFPMGMPDVGGPTSSMGGAYGQAARAQEKANAVAVQRATAEAEGIKTKAALMDQQAQEQQAKEAQRQKLAADGRKNIEDAQAALNTPDGKVDPNRLWANKNTGSKVLAGLSVVLTGLGEGLMGKGGNSALSYIQKQIDDDIQIQKENIAAERGRKKENFSAATQRNEMLRAQLGDDRAVDSAERAMRLAAVEQTAAAKVAQMAPGEARARGEQLVAAIGLDKAKAMDDASMRAAQFGLEKQKVGLQALELGLKTAQGKAGDKDAMKSINEVESRYRNVKANLAKVKGMIDDKGTWEMSGPHNAEIDRYVQDIAEDMAKIKDPSSVNRESEIEAAKKQLVQSGFFQRNSNAIKALDTVGQLVDQRRRNAYETHGFAIPDVGGLGPQVVESRVTPEGRTIEKLSDGTYREAGQGSIARAR